MAVLVLLELWNCHCRVGGAVFAILDSSHESPFESWISLGAKSEIVPSSTFSQVNRVVIVVSEVGIGLVVGVVGQGQVSHHCVGGDGDAGGGSEEVELVG